jgi:hypothetical protein
MKKGLACLILSISSSAFAELSSLEKSEAQIRDVVESFRVSILNKDKEIFSSLFYSEDIPFVAVFSDEMLKQVRMEKPNYPATVNFGKFGSPVDRMISNEQNLEEKISNVKVQTDGYLGSVHFDYTDHVDGNRRAWGTESWSMVKVDKSWKITSVTFTVTEEKSFQ